MSRIIKKAADISGVLAPHDIVIFQVDGEELMFKVSTYQGTHLQQTASSNLKLLEDALKAEGTNLHQLADSISRYRPSGPDDWPRPTVKGHRFTALTKLVKEIYRVLELLPDKKAKKREPVIISSLAQLQEVPDLKMADTIEIKDKSGNSYKAKVYYDGRGWFAGASLIEPFNKITKERLQSILISVYGNHGGGWPYAKTSSDLRRGLIKMYEVLEKSKGKKTMKISSSADLYKHTKLQTGDELTVNIGGHLYSGCVYKDSTGWYTNLPMGQINSYLTSHGKSPLKDILTSTYGDHRGTWPYALSADAFWMGLLAMYETLESIDDKVKPTPIPKTPLGKMTYVIHTGKNDWTVEDNGHYLKLLYKGKEALFHTIDEFVELSNEIEEVTGSSLKSILSSHYSTHMGSTWPEKTVPTPTWGYIIDAVNQLIASSQSVPVEEPPRSGLVASTTVGRAPKPIKVGRTKSRIINDPDKEHKYLSNSKFTSHGRKVKAIRG